MNIFENCTLCPRECGADRISGFLGYCAGGVKMRIASICVHKGEEPVISGKNGICNVFFAGCNMKCVFCQNYQISHREYFMGGLHAHKAGDLREHEAGRGHKSGDLREHEAGRGHKSGDLREHEAGRRHKSGDLRQQHESGAEDLRQQHESGAGDLGQQQGKEFSVDAAADSIIKILDTGINAVGFVTPGHYMPQVKEIIGILHERNYFPAIVYNTNSYEKPEALKQLEGLVDVYLPDFKYLDSNMASLYSGTKDYPEIVKGSIKEMFRQKGSTLILDDEGQAVSGLIIRHLILPGGTEDSKNILRWIAENLSLSVHISLMSQYFPTEQVCKHPLLGRTLNPEEYYDVVRTMEDLGFYNGWVQELCSNSYYNPDFSLENPFGD